MQLGRAAEGWMMLCTFKYTCRRVPIGFQHPLLDGQPPPRVLTHDGTFRVAASPIDDNEGLRAADKEVELGYCVFYTYSYYT